MFDEKDVVLWLPPYPATRTVWIKLPELADILLKYFDILWEKGAPALPRLRELKKKSP